MGNRIHRSADAGVRPRMRCIRRNSRRMSMSKNKLLKPICIRWCSQFPLTASQLQRKRDEFWDTAPAFEGRIEIWNALKAAAEFFERNDYEMAQAIVDGADIILPTGTLCDCYDRLGARYQLPLYVLSEPSNLLPQDESSTECASPGSAHDALNVTTSIPSHVLPAAITDTSPSVVRQPPRGSATSTPPSTCSAAGDSNSQNLSPAGCWPFCGCRRRSGGHSSNSTEFVRRPIPLLWSRLGGQSPTKCPIESNSPPSVKSTSIPLHLRLSTGEDHILDLSNERMTILEAKRLLAARTHWPEQRQRWFACGHLLPNRARLCDCHIPEGFIVQVVVHSPFDPESRWANRVSLPDLPSTALSPTNPLVASVTNEAVS
ncbi:hypothetical protein EG68_07784 [Paragonimus skrjabini miyazakii]|uniref:DC-UbP/UBTD2 N-terminal domain-containing protein n=1 Tax=Paragonimus skrjabini miyazakii TaxID=59628 RepID=A0A8S9YTN0_9TREM|nr:hypothetical protein EG68_07784 [Paragonimus skrjabini miyazakii]